MPISEPCRYYIIITIHLYQENFLGTINQSTFWLWMIESKLAVSVNRLTSRFYFAIFLSYQWLVFYKNIGILNIETICLLIKTVKTHLCEKIIIKIIISLYFSVIIIIAKCSWKLDFVNCSDYLCMLHTTVSGIHICIIIYQIV